MARQIRERRLSPVELVEAHLGQIERQNPRLNAFIEVYRDEARSTAREREGESPRGPLHGVPITIKDSFDIAGKPTTGGSTLRRAAVAVEDAVSVARLKHAGAVILGKTNLPEFLLNYESDNHLIGRTSNPWNLERTAGGSSGGESAAISSFCSAGGIGSDAGGSIRVPASFCGIAGLKPTPGRCPAYGHWPAISHPGGLLGVGGPLARSVRDVRVLFETLAGHDVRDPFSVPIELRPPSLESLRLGVMDQLNGVPLQPALRAALDRAVTLLGELGYPAEPFESRQLAEAPALWLFLFSELSAQFVYESIRGVEDRVHWSGTDWIEPYRDQPPPTSRRLCEVLARRDQLRAETLLRFDRTPVIVVPCGNVVAWPHHTLRRPFDEMNTVTVWNLLGFPALVVPMGFDADGLPAGIQLVGAPYSEELLLELGVRLEQARGPLPPPGC